MEHSTIKTIGDFLYANVDGYDIATRAKTKLAVADRSLTYGEITWDSFLQILEVVRELYPDSMTFYDLGAGTGKAVMAAALQRMFTAVRGIELLPDLHAESERILGVFNTQVRPLLPSAEQAVAIDFINGDLFEYQVKDGDVLFVQSTCFGEALMARLAEKCETIRKNGMVISISTPLPSAAFAIVYSKKYRLGWGEATIFIQQKIY